NGRLGEPCPLGKLRISKAAVAAREGIEQCETPGKGGDDLRIIAVAQRQITHLSGLSRLGALRRGQTGFHLHLLRFRGVRRPPRHHAALTSTCTFVYSRKPSSAFSTPIPDC